MNKLWMLAVIASLAWALLTGSFIAAVMFWVTGTAAIWTFEFPETWEVSCEVDSGLIAIAIMIHTGLCMWMLYGN